MRQVMPARRPQLAELGVFLLVVALPLVFTPFSASPFGDPKLVVLVGGTPVRCGPRACRSTVGIGARRSGARRRVTVAGRASSASTSCEGSPRRPTRAGGGADPDRLRRASLASIGAAMPSDLRERATALVRGGRRRSWRSLGLAVRVSPGRSTELLGDVELIGATLGNQLFAVALVAAALGVACGAIGPRREPRAAWIALGSWCSSASASPRSASGAPSSCRSSR